MLRELTAHTSWGEQKGCDLKGAKPEPRSSQLCPKGCHSVTSSMRTGLGLACSLKFPST